MIKKGLLAGLLVLSVCGVLVIAGAAKKEKSVVCVGVFDSRAVALAWGRSKAFGEELSEMRAEYDKAKAGGNTERVKELEKEGPGRQDRGHKQVFGNEPIDDVLKRIEKDLPKIAKSAGVDVLVSKWEIAYKTNSAKFVDVTWEMVELFDPDEKTMKIAEDLVKREPVPLEVLEKHKH
jgi:hypothetical protein